VFGDYYNPWPGWSWNQQRYGNSGFFGAARNDCAYYCGLYHSHPTNTFITDGSYGQWYFRAPANTFVYRAIFGGIAHSSIYVAGRNHTNSIHGILNNTYSTWEGNVNYVNQAGQFGPNPFGPAEHNYYGVTHDFCFNPRCDRRAGQESNLASFILQVDNKFSAYPDGIQSGSQKATNTMQYAQVFLGDRRAPYLTSGLPGDKDWRDDGAGTTTVAPGAHDDGLGLYAFSLSGAASGNTTQFLGCNGNPYSSRCPADRSVSFGYRLNEGIARVYLNARDAVDNFTGSHSWLERIDRSPPAVTSVTGSLFDARNRDDDRRFAGLYEASYSLTATASDSLSGLRDLEVFLVGAAGQRTRIGASTTGNVNATLRSDEFADGDYIVEVVARDNVHGQNSSTDARHIARNQFPVTLDRRGDVYHATEHAGEQDRAGLGIGEEWARLGTRTSRTVERDQIVTRRPEACESESQSGSCDTVRLRTRMGERDPSATDPYEQYNGRSDDPNLQNVSDLLRTTERSEAPSATGALSDVTRPWQTLPPGRGTRFELFESSGQRDGEADVSEPPSEGVVVTGAYTATSAPSCRFVRSWSMVRVGR